jgi:hypothetical protein
MWIIIAMVVALALGIYVGLGAPGMPGREDRIVQSGRARRLPKRHLHWIRPERRR